MVSVELVSTPERSVRFRTLAEVEAARSFAKPDRSAGSTQKRTDDTDETLRVVLCDASQWRTLQAGRLASSMGSGLHWFLARSRSLLLVWFLTSA